MWRPGLNATYSQDMLEATRVQEKAQDRPSSQPSQGASLPMPEPRFLASRVVRQCILTV